MNKRPTESEKFMTWIRSEYEYIMRHSGDLTLLKKNNLKEYKEAIWKNFNIISHSEYTEIFDRSDKWFPGSTLNYAEHVFRQNRDDKPSIIYAAAGGKSIEITWQELLTQTTSFADYLLYLKIKPGDVIVGVTENMPEQIMAFLACNAVGAVWSNLSPKTEEKYLINAFQQIEPKLLIANESYYTDGKQVNNVLKINKLAKELPLLKEIIVLPSLPPLTEADLIENGKYWNSTFSMAAPALCFEALPYEHPLFITFEKNDGNIPTPIKHQQGEMLLDHFARLNIEQNLTSNDIISPLYGIAAPLLIGSTIAQLDGDEKHPDFAKLGIKKVIL
jgi:acetoacetyl-CoA synthetase